MLNVYLEIDNQIVWQGRLTHTLQQLAGANELYRLLWRPKQKTALELIDPLTEKLNKLKTNPITTPVYVGTHDELIKFVEEYLEACNENKAAKIRTVW